MYDGLECLTVNKKSPHNHVSAIIFVNLYILTAIVVLTVYIFSWSPVDDMFEYCSDTEEQ
jgi:hypothetical protein